MMNQLFHFSPIEWSVIAITAGLFFIQLFYVILVYLRPYRALKNQNKNNPLSETKSPVSVIVYAKNESENLRKHLPALLSQDYPEYEVIVINDGSTDESEDVLQLYEGKYTNLYHTFIPEDSKYLSRKKLALTVGIKAAKHDLLLFIEANCRPMSTQWITTMTRDFGFSGTEFVLGYCAYRKKGAFFHQLVAYDNLLTGLQYLSSALKGKPFKGNGRNLSYRKDTFFRNKGFSNTLKLRAGEDDLFVNRFATSENTKVEYSPESITEMEPLERFAVWKEMKVSRAATKRYYKWGSLFTYHLENCLFLLFLVFVVGSILHCIVGNPLVSVFAVLLYIIFYIVKGMVFRKSAIMLQQYSQGLLLPILDIALPCINLYVYIYRIFRGKDDYTFNMLGKG